MKNVLVLLIALIFLVGCSKSDNNSSSSSTISGDGVSATDTPIMDSKYYGSWKYAHDGSEIYIISSTDLDFTEIDINQLEVNDNGVTKYLIRNGKKDVNISGTVKSIASSSKAPSRAGFNDIGNMDVILKNIKDQHIASKAHTDANGDFNDNTLPAGDYIVKGSKDGLSFESNITIDDDTNLGEFVLVDANTNNFKTELILNDEFVYADGQTYDAILRVHNISNINAVGINYDINITDDKLKSFTYDVVLGTITPHSYKDIPIHFSFNPMYFNEKSISINIKIGDVNAREWNDAIDFNVYRTKYRVNLASQQANIRGYITLPNGKQKNINISDGYVEVPSVINHQYYIVLSNPDLLQETAYSIGFNTSTASLTNFTNTSAYESENKNEAGAVAIENGTNISAYLHVGDIDFYKLKIDNIASFIDEQDALLNTDYISNEINITDKILKYGTLAIVDSGSIVLNGVDVGQSAIIQNGDSLAVKLTSSNSYATNNKMTITIGSLMSYYNVTVLDKDTIIDDFNFIDITDANVSTTYTSNEITISGINATVDANITNGILIKNGIELATQSTIVVNGDKIKIKLESSNLIFETVSSSIYLGSNLKIFSIYTPIIYKGFAYGAVTSPYTGRVWLDRNLGASRVCESYADKECFGDYFQWGRDADGHEKSTSYKVSTQAGSVINVGDKFIFGSSDWTTADSNGSIRATNWSKIDGSSICPVGFRVPTESEIKTETIDSSVLNSKDAFANFLKLPSAGLRSYSNGSLSYQGDLGQLWSSSVGSSAIGLYYYSNVAGIGSFYRVSGYSVRCIKD